MMYINNNGKRNLSLQDFIGGGKAKDKDPKQKPGTATASWLYQTLQNRFGGGF